MAFIKRLVGAGMPEADLERLNHDLTIRVGGMMLALGGVLVAIEVLGH